jgi:hypothetical protein
LGDASFSTTRRPKMARTLTLSALYIMALGTMFGAYALSL